MHADSCLMQSTIIATAGLGHDRQQAVWDEHKPVATCLKSGMTGCMPPIVYQCCTVHEIAALHHCTKLLRRC